MTTFEVEFIDTLSNGKICKTSITAENITEQDVINHFGLKDKDVIWFKVIKK